MVITTTSNGIAMPTCRNSFWKSARGSMFQAMVSVMAVNIQFSSPSGVRRSVCLPGIRSMSSFARPSPRSRLRLQNHLNATCGLTQQVAARLQQKQGNRQEDTGWG
jgi:hypothetical protein